MKNKKFKPYQLVYILRDNGLLYCAEIIRTPRYPSKYFTPEIISSTWEPNKFYVAFRTYMHRSFVPKNKVFCTIADARKRWGRKIRLARGERFIHNNKMYLPNYC